MTLIYNLMTNNCFTAKLCFWEQQELQGLAERRGPLASGASVNMKQSSLKSWNLSFLLKARCCVDGVWRWEKKPVWRGKPEQFVTATFPLWFLRTRSRLWQVGDRRLFINDPTCEGASSNLGLMPPQGPHEAFLSDSRSSLSLIKRLKLFQTRALSNFFVSLRNRVSGSVDVGRRARALVSVQSLTNCRLFVKLHLWMRSQSREASLNTTSPLHLHRRYTWKGLSVSLYSLCPECPNFFLAAGHSSDFTA